MRRHDDRTVPMVPDVTEPEPNGWELMRSINALRESVDKLAAGMVTQATLAIYTQAQKDTDARQDARLKELESAVEESRKTKAQQWFGIGSSIFAAVLALGVGLVINFTRGGAG